MAIPALNVSQFLDDSVEAKSAFAKQLVDCLSEHGAVKLTGYSMSNTIGELFKYDEKYFDLPMDIRRKNARSEAPTSQSPSRGYKGYGEEKVWMLSPASANLPNAQELKEYFDMGPPLDHKFPTPWPDEVDLPGFRQFMESQYESFQSMAMQLMQAIEIGAQVPQGTFTSRCLPAASELRLNHYPAVSTQDLDTQTTLRSWPHTDTGLFSFVIQGSRDGGLSVEDRTRPGTFVVQAGGGSGEMIILVANTLERWTNGTLRACLHKVAIPEKENWDPKAAGIPERRSIVFFFRANGQESAGPLPMFVSAERPAKYEEMLVSKYNQQRDKLMYG